MTTMYKLARCLHFIGLAMFLGSILGHSVLAMVPGAETDPATLLVVRQAISVATNILTLPGLLLLILTGIFLTFRHGFFKRRWLTVHQVLAALIVINAFVILEPAGAELLRFAQQVVDGAVGLAALQGAAEREMTFGLISLVLALLATAIAVFRPGLRRSDAS